MQLADVVAGVQAGQRRAIGRLITLLESDDPTGPAALHALRERLGRAHVVGVTGAPGTGKSTLVDRLIAEARRRGLRVGVVAVDPSSPFTGGAILGDRIRMGGHANDPNVFIRSMGSRGALGGLSTHTLEAVQALDAAGFDLVLVETVGVGQAEVDVARLADTVLVVLVPNLGDDVQAVKAGIMEIADAFVVNKADLVGSDKVAAEVEASLMLAHPAMPPAGEPWTPPILRTVAERADGVAAVLDAVAAHKAWSQASGTWAGRRRARLAAEVRAHLQRAVWERAFARDGSFRPGYAALEARLARGELSAREAAAQVLASPTP
ncbi:MAG: GTPase [Thermoplasmata archaeon]|jgi:LAO/AO transport system kinase|nr:GTPase [Thermoplasmata archaeon]